MPTHRTRPGAAAGHPSLTPPVLAGWLSPFRACFSAPIWSRVLVLVAGAVLAPGKRTVTQALRVMGLASSPGFSRYHEVLNRARWNGCVVARTLLAQVLKTFLPVGEVVIGVDDTIERRWGLKIKARGLYRDPVQSSRDHFVRACQRRSDSPQIGRSNFPQSAACHHGRGCGAAPCRRASQSRGGPASVT